MSDILLIPAKRKLSKSQAAFNTLVKRIDKRKKEIEQSTSFLRMFYNRKTAVLKPAMEERLQWQVKYITLLDTAFEKEKFNKKDKEKLANIILNMCNMYDPLEMPNPFLEQIISKYESFLFQLLSPDERKMTKDLFSGMMRDFGFDVDLNEENAFDFKNFKEKFRADFRQKMHDEASENAFNRKNKHVGGFTAKSKALAEQLNKSWKKIYVSLAKALHPDTETDAQKKAEKEAAFKDVTVAYENNNFHQLLQLHIQHTLQNGDPEYFDDEQLLKQYLSILKKQDAELKQQLNLVLDEVFSNDLDEYNIKAGESSIIPLLKKQKKIIEKETEKLKRETELFSDPEFLKKEIKRIKLEDLQPQFDEDSLPF